MTRLSRCWSAEQYLRAARGLARCSLFPAVLGATSGCFDTAPTYTAPVQSPPIILGNLVDPSTVEVKTITLNNPPPTPVPLNVPFRSIDAGESLVAVFWHDYEPNLSQEQKNALFLSALSRPPDSRPLDEQQDRVVAFPFEASPFSGCHTVTMHLAHASTYPTDQLQGINDPGKLPATNQFDIAEVTWWFDVRDPSTPSQPACWSGE